jgi:hypothetical protein
VREWATGAIARSVVDWTMRMLLAALFLFQGTTKFGGRPFWQELFAEIGLGDWFRYLTGAVEILGSDHDNLIRLCGDGGGSTTQVSSDDAERYSERRVRESSPRDAAPARRPSSRVRRLAPRCPPRRRSPRCRDLQSGRAPAWEPARGSHHGAAVRGANPRTNRAGRPPSEASIAAACTAAEARALGRRKDAPGVRTRDGNTARIRPRLNGPISGPARGVRR